MTAIAFCHDALGIIERLKFGEQALGTIDRGWQGKRPAVGRAYVVGRAGGFWLIDTELRWRTLRFLEGHQCARRQPSAIWGSSHHDRAR